MLLDQFKKNRDAIREIGRDAAEKGRPLAIEPSWADDEPPRRNPARDMPQGRRDAVGSTDRNDDLPMAGVRARRKI